MWVCRSCWVSFNTRSDDAHGEVEVVFVDREETDRTAGDDAHGEVEVVFFDREGTDVVLPSDIAQNVGLQKLLSIVQQTNMPTSRSSSTCN